MERLAAYSEIKLSCTMYYIFFLKMCYPKNPISQESLAQPTKQSSKYL